MTWFCFGLACGVLLTLPMAAAASWRRTRRFRMLEQRARAVQRLAELGTLTGGLAHEIKNPLSTVGLNLQLLQEDLAELQSDVTADSAVGDRLGRMLRRFDALARETRRVRDVLDDFLQYAGRIRLDRRPTNINELIRELCDFFAPQAAEAAVNLRTQFDAPDPNVPVDHDLLKQALLNLMINACQAMVSARKSQQASSGSDELIIRTHKAAGLGPSGDLHIHVIDTGPGMDQATVQKIFQPYFSAKRGGTGLGLPTARRIIEEHGGSITCHSEPGRGTDFAISLPYDAAADEEG